MTRLFPTLFVMEARHLTAFNVAGVSNLMVEPAYICSVMAQDSPLTIVHSKKAAKYVVLKPLIAAACLRHPPDLPVNWESTGSWWLNWQNEPLNVCPLFPPLPLISVFVGSVLLRSYFPCLLSPVVNTVLWNGSEVFVLFRREVLF